MSIPRPRKPILLALSLTLAGALVACLVNRDEPGWCSSRADCSGSESCIANQCVVECSAESPASCPASRPVCLVEEYRCVECLESADCGADEQCLDDSCAPGLARDFALVDHNAASPTFGSAYRLSDHSGDVVLIFFAGLG